MAFQLSATHELKEKYKGLQGRIVDVMPRLTAQGYQLLSLAEGIERRLSAPAEIITAWQENDIDTGDGVAYGTKEDVLMVLDASLLRKLTPKSGLAVGALPLDFKQWGELRASKNTLYLNDEEVRQAHGSGYFFRRGVWQPENEVVEGIWKFLAREKDLQAYTKMVGEVGQALGAPRIMTLCFARDTLLTMRSWFLNKINSLSGSDLRTRSFNHYNSYLIGVTPYASDCREKGSEYCLKDSGGDDYCAKEQDPKYHDGKRLKKKYKYNGTKNEKHNHKDFGTDQ